MDILTSFSIIALAALIHASFQVSVSVITLLSGHAIRSKVSAQRSSALTMSFFGGVVTMTMLLVSTIAYITAALLRGHTPVFAWGVTAGLLAGLGVAVWTFYYRKQPGTVLWVPRPLARFLEHRTHATRSTPEAFNLGLMSVLAEIIFIIPPIFAAALAATMLPSSLQLYGILLYVLIASIGVGTVAVLVGGGWQLSRIQRWRENNKRFLQFAAGSALVVLGFYIYITYVVAAIVTTGGGL